MSVSLDDLLSGLGGEANIAFIEPCVTRLRAEVRDPLQVNVKRLLSGGAYGVMFLGKAVQIIVGPHADLLASELQERWR